MQKSKGRTDRRNVHIEKVGTQNSLMFINKNKFTITFLLSVHLRCEFWYVCVHVFKNTMVQLNILLSRHSYVLDQCYYYSIVIKKIWPDCPFKAMRRKVRIMPRYREKAMIVSFSIDFYK